METRLLCCSLLCDSVAVCYRVSSRLSRLMYFDVCAVCFSQSYNFDHFVGEEKANFLVFSIFRNVCKFYAAE